MVSIAYFSFLFFFLKQAFKLVKTSLTQQMVQSEATD